MYKCNCGLNVYSIRALLIIFHVWPFKTKEKIIRNINYRMPKTQVLFKIKSRLCYNISNNFTHHKDMWGEGGL